jgi:hypothetical protein
VNLFQRPWPQAFASSARAESPRDRHSAQHPDDTNTDYTAETGGFSLDEEQVANSFAKALTHAAELCGGRPSLF